MKPTPISSTTTNQALPEEFLYGASYASKMLRVFDYGGCGLWAGEIYEDLKRVTFYECEEMQGEGER